MRRCIGMVMWIGLVSLIALAQTFDRARADEPFALEGGERIVFFGDSITQAGQYIVDVELFLMTRFPEREFTIINHGISSQTVSGLSEPGHDPPRENALDRFTRDITAWKPDVVVACFGMNDGIYSPFDPDRFGRYQEGIGHLIERTRAVAHARLTLLTPPPFDPYRRKASDPDAVHFGYKFPYIDYDSVLGRYSEWLATRRGVGVVVADVHTVSNRHLEQRRRDRVSFHLAPDSVHPDVTGHWLMAQTLLTAWRAPATVAEARVDVAHREAPAGEVSEVVVKDDGAVEFTWRTRLPFPIDPDCDPESIRLEKVAERLNRHRLAIANLPADRYRLTALVRPDTPPGDEANPTEAAAVGEFSREQLADGLDLTSLPDFPTNRIAQAARSALETHRATMYRRWRERISDPARANDAGLDPADAPATASIRRLCRPRVLEIRLVPVGR